MIFGPVGGLLGLGIGGAVGAELGRGQEERRRELELQILREQNAQAIEAERVRQEVLGKNLNRKERIEEARKQAAMQRALAGGGGQ